MATIYGTDPYYYSYWYHRWMGGNDTLTGTTSSDYIYGRGGNDTIYADYGSDTVYGGSGNDTIIAGSSSNPWSYAYWGNDAAYGGTGSDTINYSWTFSNVILFGDDTTLNSADGVDTIYSGAGHDWIYGGGGNDDIRGGAGNDVIYGDLANGGVGDDTIDGGAGVDSIYGGAGNDRIIGGADGDWLSGGAGYDIFDIFPGAAIWGGESGLTWETTDAILDYNSYQDRIEFHLGGGNYSNYVEGTFQTSHYTEHDIFQDALTVAQGLARPGTDYIFLTDGQDGYLFASSHEGGQIDTGIQLVGLTSINQFDAYQII